MGKQGMLYAVTYHYSLCSLLIDVREGNDVFKQTHQRMWRRRKHCIHYDLAPAPWQERKWCHDVGNGLNLIFSWSHIFCEMP